MRTLFLDIDGVGHPVSVIEGLDEINSLSVDLEHLIAERGLGCWWSHLAELLEGHDDVGIVVHSSWRRSFQNHDLRRLLGPLGRHYETITHKELGRHEGIEELVKRAGLEHYLVIDDAAHEFPTEYAPLVLTHPEQGLSDPQVLARIRQWLEATAEAAKPEAASAAGG